MTTSDNNDFENSNQKVHQLTKAGKHDDVLNLLARSPDWMTFRISQPGGFPAFVADLQLALNHYKDPVVLEDAVKVVQLRTMRQLISYQISRYKDNELRALTWLGRKREALDFARLRSSPEEKYKGLEAIFSVTQEMAQPDWDLLAESKDIGNTVGDSGTKEYAHAIHARALAEKGEFQEAEEIAITLDTGGWSHLTKGGVLEYIAVNMAKMGQFDNVQAMCERHDFYTIRETIPIYIAVGRYEEAIKLARKINTQYSTGTLVALLTKIATHYFEKGRETEANTLIAEASERAANMPWEEGHSSTYWRKRQKITALCDVAVALHKTGRIAEAHAVFIETENLTESDLDQLADLLRSLAGIGKVDEVFRIFLRNTIGFQRLWNGIFWEELVTDLIDADCLDAAREIATIATENKDYDPLHGGSWLRLKALAVGLAKAGLDDEATLFFKQARETLLEKPPTHPGKETEAFVDLIAALVQYERMDEANAVFEEMRSFDIMKALGLGAETHSLEKIKAQFSLVKSLAHSGYFDKAKAVLEQIDWDKKQAKAFVALGEAYHDHERYTEGYAALERALSIIATPDTNPYSGDNDLFRQIALGFARHGRYDRALEIARRMSRKTDQMKVFTKMISLYLDVGRKSDARDIFDEAFQILEDSDDPPTTRYVESMLKDIAKMLVFAEYPRDELRIKRLIDFAEPLYDTKDYDWVLANVAIALSQAGCFDKARELVDRIRAERWHIDALCELAAASCLAHRKIEGNALFERAQQYIKSQETEDKPVWSIGRHCLRDAFVKAGRFEEALDLARSIEKEGDKVSALLGILEENIDSLQQQELLNSLIDEILQIARQSEWLRKNIWHRLSPVLVKLGREEEAIGLFQEMRDLAYAMHRDYGDFNPDWQRWGTIEFASKSLIMHRHINEGVGLTNEIDSLHPSNFMEIMAEWLPLVHSMTPPVLLTCFQEITRILGWDDPDWKNIHDCLLAD